MALPREDNQPGSPVGALIFVASPLLLILFCAILLGACIVRSDLRTIDGGEFRDQVNRSLESGATESEVITFIEGVAADPPEKSEAFVDTTAVPASTFEQGAGEDASTCTLSCELVGVSPDAPVLFLRLDNTRGGVLFCDGGGLFAYFVLDSDRRFVEVITETFWTCI